MCSIGQGLFEIYNVHSYWHVIRHSMISLAVEES